VTALALTAITDFLLAGEALFLAGRMSARPKARFSAAWYFSGFLMLLGVAALLGGIDHGFFEPAGLPRYAIQRADWIVLAGVTFCLLMATVQHYFPPRPRRIALPVALVQFAAATAAAFAAGSFLVVILNYAPVMLLLLVLSIAGRKNAAGSGWMAAGILILFAASGIQAAGVDLWSPLDRNGLYHVISMIGVFALYRGGQGLRAE
jgi:Family of unknown function (DUF6962)